MDVRDLLLRVDGDAAEVPGKVDDQPAFDGRGTSGTVTASADCNRQTCGFGIAEGDGDVVQSTCPDDLLSA